MKLGFLTACMPERPLEDIAAFAAANGYEALELAAWPSLGDRPFTASHLAADRFDAAEAERVRGALERHGLALSALAYYDNNLHPDPVEREAAHAHLRACIDAAAQLGRPPVTRRATPTASTSSSPTPTPRSATAPSPTGCRASPTARAACA